MKTTLVSSRLAEKIVCIAFFSSGFCALIYEIVWERWLELIFGVSTYAVAVVITCFMAGLGIGSILFGKIADRTKNTLYIYGIIEIGIGIYALAIPYLLILLKKLYLILPIFTHQGTYINIFLLFLLSSFVLIIPTILMGGTLPLISKFMIKELSSFGKKFSFLYGINTLGGVLGCFITGFFLIKYFGLNITNYFAIAINILFGFIVLVLAKRNKTFQETKIKENNNVFIEPNNNNRMYKFSKFNLYLFFLVIFLSGFTALAYEVLWFRALKFVIGSSIYAFSIMLTTFLIGLGIGSIIVGYIIDKDKVNLIILLGLLEIIIAISTFLTFPIFPRIWGLLSFFSKLHFSFMGNWMISNVIHFLIVFSIMIIPTVSLGMIFPIANKILIDRIDKLGFKVGTIYFSNTLGAVFGSSITGFVLIPVLGLRQSIFIIICLNIFIALILFLFSLKQVHNLKKSISKESLLIIGSLSLFFLFFSKEIYIKETDDPAVLYYKDGISASIRVYVNDNVKYLVTDNLYVQGGIDPKDKLVHPKRFGYLPLLIHPNVTIENALYIGLGTGISVSALAEGDVQAIDIVEIIPELHEAVKIFGDENSNILSNQKVKLIINDGRNYVFRTKKKYDLIIGDLFFPDCAGTGNLYSLEHFINCKNKLTKNGMFVQWIPLHQVSTKELKVIINTFCNVFPHVSLWWGTISNDPPVAGLVGTINEQSIDFQLIKNKTLSLSKGLKEVLWENYLCILSNFIMGDKQLRNFSDKTPYNTDEHPYIEFSAPLVKTMGKEVIINNLRVLTEEMKHNNIKLKFSHNNYEKINLKINLYRASKIQMFNGLVLNSMGNNKKALDEIAIGLKMNPESKEMQFIWDMFMEKDNSKVHAKSKI